MTKDEAREFWHSFMKIPLHELETAAEFYEQSPDGQYDDLASQAIKFLIHQRKAREAGVE